MRINKTIATLIFADLLLYSGWGLFSPIFAIFVTDQIKNGSLEMVGFIVATYWLVKSIIQPFLANFLDIKKGEEDDFFSLILGMTLASFVPLGYFFATNLFHVFFLEAIRGVAMACVVPSWYGIFTRHINKDWYAFSWSVHSTALGVMLGFSAAFGGIIAVLLGFRVLFIVVSLLGFSGVLTLLYVRKRILSDEFQNSSFFSSKDFENKDS